MQIERMDTGLSGTPMKAVTPNPLKVAASLYSFLCALNQNEKLLDI